MRIISQDGTIDFPYENFSLSIAQNNCIVATRDVVARPNEILIRVVAKYSTKAKARKAMEMLHEVYINHVMYKTLDGNQKALFSLSVPENAMSYLYGMFQFPADDEKEV